MIILRKQKYNFESYTGMLSIYLQKWTLQSIIGKEKKEPLLVVPTERSYSTPCLPVCGYIWKQEVIEVKRSRKSGVLVRWG